MGFKRQYQPSVTDLGNIIDEQGGMAVRKENRQAPKAWERDAIQLLSEVSRSWSPSAHLGRKIVVQNKKES